MAFKEDTFNLCHELTPIGEKHYMQLLIAAALEEVERKESVENGSTKQTEVHMSPIRRSIRHSEARSSHHDNKR